MTNTDSPLDSTENQDSVVQNKSIVHGDIPMAEDELDKIFNHWRGSMMTNGFNSPSTANAIDTEAKAAINTYTTNKIIERLEMIKATDSTRWVTNPSGMAGISFNVIDEHIAELRKRMEKRTS